MSDFAQEVKRRLDITREMHSLLPQGKGNSRRCWNSVAHKSGDRTPSLSFNPSTSAWECHSCKEKGDIFTLYMKVNNVSFAEAVRHYASVAGMSMEPVKAPKEEVKPQAKPIAVNNRDLLDYEVSKMQPDILHFLSVRYCISEDTVISAGLRYSEKRQRLLVPIKDTTGQLLNIKAHDILRHHATWETPEGVASKAPSVEDIMRQNTALIPRWDGRKGKAMSIAGHGSNRLYGMETLPRMKAGNCLIVGGELKALALRQLGVPAFSFTTGEGSINWDDLELLKNAGLVPVILMDPDTAGCNAAMKMATAMKCKRFHWPAQVVEELPYKGDITDLIRTHGKDWESVLEIVDYEIPNSDIEDVVMPILFGDLVNPEYVGKLVSVEGIISGKSEVPYVVPFAVRAKCPYGRVSSSAKCESCKLPQMKYELEKVLNLTEVVSLAGKQPEKALREAKGLCGINPKCDSANIEFTKASVDPIVVAPTIKYENSETSVRQHPIYVVSDRTIRLTEGQSYRMQGQMIPDPNNGRFMLAVNKYERTSDDALTFMYNDERDQELRRFFHDQPPGKLVQDLVTMLCEHVIHIYNQDDMIKSILLCLFMPFQFRLGDQKCERVCPQVVILGDSNVGKSTACKNIIRFYGSGRFHDAGSSPTFAGLIGGNMTMPNKSMMFTWGVLPQSHRAFIAMDEFNKMPLVDIERLTNTLSSGRAERITVASGGRSTPCHVRLLTLANMRNNTKQVSLRKANKLKALQELYGSPQDLGRVEFAHVQTRVEEDVYNTVRVKKSDLTYTQEMARYQLSWVWSLSEDTISFEDYTYLLRKASQLGKAFEDHPLMFPQQIRWKLGRVAAGIASLLYSNKDGNLVVTNKHVDLASAWLTKKAEEVQ